MFKLTSPRPADALAIENLLDLAFGSDRRQKISYRYRKQVAEVAELARVARADGQLVGTIQYWPIVIGSSKSSALLLGPVAVVPERQGEGIAVCLIRSSLKTAGAMGHRVVLLVGDQNYYGQFGFTPAGARGIIMTGEQPHRVLARALGSGGPNAPDAPEVFEGVSGIVLPADQGDIE